MRILYDSKNKIFKTKFGTLRQNEGCTVNIHIPKNCRTDSVRLVFQREDGSEYSSYCMLMNGECGEYEIYSCDFCFVNVGLYFYYFVIKTENSEFSLYKQGYDMTNIAEGELWQISVIPQDFDVPAKYKGNIMYQIFPDRFYKKGECDTTHKIKPFSIHKNVSDIPDYTPDENGIVWNNDFFGGNLNGITAKLDYLKDLNIDIIYLNPIFKAFSNHRYDTADYMKIDEMLGTEEDFELLCNEAHKRGISVVLDGVFSHTGSNSVYFDSENLFGNGAVSNEASPYREWFDFKNYPNEYTSWWGIKTLPCVDENNRNYRDFIINNDDSVIAHWIRLGADGFRLDVADELPDSFILELRKKMKSIKKDSILIGEVWEDASNKCSYGQRRKYFTDGEFDSVMNYPFRNAIIDYCLGNDNGYNLRNIVMTIAENYPESVLNSVMNIVSTHDTVRILTTLGVSSCPSTKSDRAVYKLSDTEYKNAQSRLFVAVFLQFVLPGMPCIYYGDEIGTEGFEDPFCRTFFDWSKVNDNFVFDFYKSITDIRANNDVLKYGDIQIELISDGVVRIIRSYSEEVIEAVINTSDNVYEEQVSGNIIFAHNTDNTDGKNYVKKLGFILKDQLTK